jgi:chemotaxis protein CheC
VEKKKQELGNEALSAVRLGFKGPFSGIVLLVFPIESAAKLVALLTEDEMGSLDLDEIKIGTLTEMGNIVLNSVMGTIGNLLKQRIHYSVPTYEENPIGTLLATGVPDPDAMIVWMQTRFTIEQHQVGGDMILIFQVGSLDLLLAAIDREMGVQS